MHRPRRERPSCGDGRGAQNGPEYAEAWRCNALLVATPASAPVWRFVHVARKLGAFLNSDCERCLRPLPTATPKASPHSPAQPKAPAEPHLAVLLLW